ncbi:hypothetical protein JCM8547_006924 [Rhodosporidiobolus lusitaniae]
MAVWADQITVSLGTAIPRDLHDSTVLDLDKRAPEPLTSPGRPRQRGGQPPREKGTPSDSFQPDDPGRGYDVDSSGHGHPGGIPDGWRWYGRQLAPYRGWRPPPRWEPPFVFIRVWIKVRWWSAYGVPSHWGWRPKDPRGSGRWYQRNGAWYWSSSSGGSNIDSTGGSSADVGSDAGTTTTSMI